MGSRDDAAPAVVAGALLVFFLTPLLAHAWEYPVGPDAPYYLWSTRLAGEAGLSVTDFRPGLHALMLLVSGGTGLSLLQLMGALTVALAVSAGLAAAVLSERGLGRDPLRSAAIGIAAGAFTARLASGYLANLLFAVLFLAAIAVVVGRRERIVLGALLLGAAGLAHGLFMVVGAGVLGGGAVLRLLTAREDRGLARQDLARLGGAALGGAAIAGAGFVLASLGRPPSQDERIHSRDALLKRADLGSMVSDAYRARWREAVDAFRLPVTLPLAAVGGAALRAGRTGVNALFGSIVASWATITVAGVVIGLWTARIPAGRVLNFALVLPILGAVAAVAAGRWVAARNGRLGVAVGTVLFLGLVAGPFLAWTSSHPFMSRYDLEAGTAAARSADNLPAGTPLVYVIDHRGPHPGWELARFVNLIRVALPADRSQDLHVFVGEPQDYFAGHPGLNGDPEHDGIARDAFARVRPVLSEPHAAYVLRTFNQRGWDGEAGVPVGALVRQLASPTPEAFPVGEVAPSTAGLHPAFVPILAVALLGALALAGAGWVAWLGSGLDAQALALAPAAGAASLVLFGLLFDVAGLRLRSFGGLAAAAALVGSAAAWHATRRRAGSESVEASD
ncbi:MAG: hypothetical protein LC722_05650 [Actinobacteria bacterium]|nr:hypothetical protein [Actinomycetota bacterium]